MWHDLSRTLIGRLAKRWKAGVLVAVSMIAAIFVVQVLAADNRRTGHSGQSLRAHPHTIEVSFPQIDAWKYDLPGVTQVEERIKTEALLAHPGAEHHRQRVGGRTTCTWTKTIS